MKRLFTGVALAVSAAAFAVPPVFAAAELDTIIESRPAEEKARDTYRNPAETLKFFGVTPSSRVVEVLPGGGWYTRILLPYVAEKGAYAGANYSLDMRELTEEQRKERSKWLTEFPERAAGWVEGEPEIRAFFLGSAPDELKGTMDHVLFVRALHHLNRVDPAFFKQAAEESFELLKPGGVVGVVQHRAPADAPADWAKGGAGYLKEADVIAKFEAAGFELAEKSEINANPKDTPTTDDAVWRLPPALRGPEETKAARKAIGESDRMTLKFVKPGS